MLTPPSSPTLALLVARSQRTCYRGPEGETKWVDREELGEVRRFKPGPDNGRRYNPHMTLMRKRWPARARGWPSCSAL